MGFQVRAFLTIILGFEEWRVFGLACQCFAAAGGENMYLSMLLAL